MKKKLIGIVFFSVVAFVLSGNALSETKVDKRNTGEMLSTEEMTQFVSGKKLKLFYVPRSRISYVEFKTDGKLIGEDVVDNTDTGKWKVTADKKGNGVLTFKWIWWDYARVNARKLTDGSYVFTFVGTTDLHSKDLVAIK